MIPSKTLPKSQQDPPTLYGVNPVYLKIAGLQMLQGRFFSEDEEIRGAPVDINPLVGADVGANSQLALDRLESVFLAGQMSDPTRATLEKEATDPQILGAKLDDPVKQVNVGLITGLVLGSPEFQKR